MGLKASPERVNTFSKMLFTVAILFLSSYIRTPCFETFLQNSFLGFYSLIPDQLYSTAGLYTKLPALAVRGSLLPLEIHLSWGIILALSV